MTEERAGIEKENSGEEAITIQPPPPEAEFLDPLDRDEEKELRSEVFFKQPWLRWTGVIVVPLLFIAFFYFQSQMATKPKRLQLRPEGRPEVVTQRSLDRAIDVSKKETSEPVLQSRQEGVKAKKRTYTTAIEVFDFKKEKIEHNGLNQESRHQKENRLGLPSGTKISGLLSNRIFSFNVAAPVLAVVAKDVTWQGKVVIPKDSRFLGEASVLKSLDRINVNFELLIFPDGHEMHIRAMALSEDGSSGIKGKVEKHRDVKTLKAVGETLLGGVSLFARTGSSNSGAYSLEDQLRLNLAQNLTTQAAQDLRSVKTEQSVTVEAYTPIQVILLEAI
jgi:type IV secretory pathway VirB10-like protein